MHPSTSQGRPYLSDGPVNPDGVSCSDTTNIDFQQANAWWESIACVWSPRPYVRIDPQRTHTFSTTQRFTSGPPGIGVPYALHLTDETGRFRLLALDFDAHHTNSTATADLTACTSALAAAGIEHLTCSSGPSGGYHVWIRLSTAVSPALLEPLVDVFTASWSSLDRSPLTNPRTGCVRAPGAPHHSGGISMPLGNADIRPTSLRALKRVVDQLSAHTQVATEPKSTLATLPVQVDVEGHPQLAGPRRPLSARSRALAAAPVTINQDASAIGWSILLACAHARMGYREVAKAAFTDRWPGLEFLRTYRTGEHRAPRFDAAQELARQWAKAVTTASYTTRAAGTSSPGRLSSEQAVASLLARMDAEHSQWQGKTGAQRRLVLLALAERILSAATQEVHFSERDWALAAGLLRDTVSGRLAELVEQGWLRRVRRSSGPWAATWGVGTLGGGNERSGAVFTPKLAQQLHEELECARADIWHAPALGVLGLRVWLLLRTSRGPVGDLARRLGVCAATVRSKLRALQAVGLCSSSGRAYQGRSRLNRAAAAAGVVGARADRVRLYRLQSAVFVWWFTTRYQAEDSDALAEWGSFPTPAEAEQVHPIDIALAYGATAIGPPVEATTWGAAMAAQDRHRETDPASWWELVAATRAALPAADVLAAPHQWAPTAA